MREADVLSGSDIPEKHPVPHPYVQSLSHAASHPHPAAGVLEREGPAHPAATGGRNTCLEGNHQEKVFEAMGKEVK